MPLCSKPVVVRYLCVDVRGKRTGRAWLGFADGCLVYKRQHGSFRRHEHFARGFTRATCQPLPTHTTPTPPTHTHTYTTPAWWHLLPPPPFASVPPRAHHLPALLPLHTMLPLPQHCLHRIRTTANDSTTTSPPVRVVGVVGCMVFRKFSIIIYVGLIFRLLTFSTSFWLLELPCLISLVCIMA